MVRRKFCFFPPTMPEASRHCCLPATSPHSPCDHLLPITHWQAEVPFHLLPISFLPSHSERDEWRGRNWQCDFPIRGQDGPSERPASGAWRHWCECGTDLQPGGDHLGQTVASLRSEVPPWSCPLSMCTGGSEHVRAGILGGWEALRMHSPGMASPMSLPPPVHMPGDGAEVAPWI